MIQEDYKIQGWVEHYSELVEMSLRIPPVYRKYLAEDLLNSLEEDGYECKWEVPNLTARKVKEL